MKRYPQRRVANWMRSSRGSEKHYGGQLDAAVSAVIIDSSNERPPDGSPRFFEKKDGIIDFPLFMSYAE